MTMMTNDTSVIKFSVLSGYMSKSAENTQSRSIEKNPSKSSWIRIHMRMASKI